MEDLVQENFFFQIRKKLGNCTIILGHYIALPMVIFYFGVDIVPCAFSQKIFIQKVIGLPTGSPMGFGFPHAIKRHK